MNINAVNNQSNPNFQARLYLKNISKENLPYLKSITKDFNAATKDLPNGSFSLRDVGDMLELKSNKSNYNAQFSKEVLNICSKQTLLDSLVNNAKILRNFETLLLTPGKKSSKPGTKVTMKIPEAEYPKFVENLEKFIKNQNKKK